MAPKKRAAEAPVEPQRRNGRGSKKARQQHLAAAIEAQVVHEQQDELDICRQNASQREKAFQNGTEKLRFLVPDYNGAALLSGAMMSQYSSAVKAHSDLDRFAMPEGFLSQCGEEFKKLRSFTVDRIFAACSSMRVCGGALVASVRLFDYYQYKQWESGVGLFEHNVVAVGYTCLWIASKFESDAALVNDLVSLMNQVPWDKRGKDFTPNDFLNLEIHIQGVVGMRVAFPTPCSFTDRFAEAGGIAMDTKDHSFVYFLQELTLTDLNFSKYKAIIITSAAVYMTRKMWLLMEGQPRHGEDSWTDTLARVTGVRKSQLRHCAGKMADLLRTLGRPDVAEGIQDAFVAKWSLPVNYALAATLYD
ncbi:unnamed protein product [Vitrella brassicaformis CCMP3155]|uniref:Cyclin C-terminal domain-containing protein n=1 Tax=Vitrella brassicaformis (strain CCMP3155) TaxID=1169540 RepID=A0A0G4EW38_VITBC|nr:unnamed protein product [Vitrella brassicaformis CCMP3155]|eukprot:CEM03013.1 unnamed protein product [Vitrella brassicaformis CCMP3155]